MTSRPFFFCCLLGVIKSYPLIWGLYYPLIEKQIMYIYILYVYIYICIYIDPISRWNVSLLKVICCRNCSPMTFLWPKAWWCGFTRNWLEGWDQQNPQIHAESGGYVSFPFFFRGKKSVGKSVKQTNPQKVLQYCRIFWWCQVLGSICWFLENTSRCWFQIFTVLSPLAYYIYTCIFRRLLNGW